MGEAQLRTIFDVGLVYRSNHNYGANLTHYALSKVLANMGKSVLMIDMPKGLSLSLPVDRDDPFELFYEEPYEIIDIYNNYNGYGKGKIYYWRAEHLWDIGYANDVCDCFIVGSDQLWRNYFIKGSGYYSLLGWVMCNKKKISYATSFGVDYFEGNDYEKRIITESLRRFDYISTRERSGVKILNSFSIHKCGCVLDPVFLCDKNYYKKLAVKSNKKYRNEKYCVAYFLDQSERKAALLHRIKERIAVVEIDDAMKDEITSDISKVEDWLSAVDNCSVCVTDSFHGTCFALILKKKFLVIADAESQRGYSRIFDLLSQIGLENYIVSEKTLDLLDWENIKDIDYCVVDTKLNSLRDKSYTWLKNAINGKDIKNKTTELDVEWIYLISKQKKNYNTKIERIKSVIDNATYNGRLKVVIWGTGCKFSELINSILECTNVDFLVDRNRNQQGKIFCNSLRCFDPEELRNKKDVLVVILIDNVDIVRTIVDELAKYGINHYISYNDIVERYASEMR